MAQTSIADFSGILTRQKRMERKIDELRSTNSVTQEKLEAKDRALQALKGQVRTEHASTTFHEHKGGLEALRWQLYDYIRDVLFPQWNPIKDPDGLDYRYIIDEFIKSHPKAKFRFPDTLRRRLGELTDPKIHDPPPLRRTKLGYYLLSTMEVEH